MNVRALVCDIYCTVLDVGPPPADAETQWEILWRDYFERAPRLALSEVAREAERIIAREHTSARAAGIAFPEIFWPHVLCEALPELQRCTAEALDDFALRHASLRHSVRLAEGAAKTLQHCRARGILLGIASNAQPYTLRELAGALTGAGLPHDLFTADLTFWSFAHGFSKPDPHVFRLLGARLLARGLRPHECLMVGDRLDNDILPAKSQGWPTWQLRASTSASGGSSSPGGSWAELLRALEQE
jgi:FMN phosphatase YigB (HAD superfamily)